jgi:P-type conjugative transfer protein TrbJ
MTRKRKCLVLAAAAAALLTPTAGYSVQIVFDPTNFTQIVEQVGQDVELVTQFHQEIQNQLSMLQGWGFTELGGILQSMSLYQQVFSAAGDVYSSLQPGDLLNNQFPDLPASFKSVTNGQIASMRQSWDQEEREVLIENRTVQNDTYLDMAPTAQRIQEYVEHSNAAPGATAAVQAGNEELATVVAQIQSIQAQEITTGRTEVEQDAEEQAEEAYAEQQRQAVRGDWANPPPPSTSLADAFPMANQ